MHDSDVLPALGGLRVMHLSGRMPGSPQRPRGRLTFPNAFFSDHMGLARRSIERLTGLDVDTLLLAHFPSPQLGAREALRALVP